MTPISVLIEIDSFLRLLHESRVALFTNKVVERPGRLGFRRLTWATSDSVPRALFRQNSATVSEYRSWVDYQGYSAVLYDGSLIQMSYDFENSELIGHRLLYFPCPFDLDNELLDALGLVDVVDLYQNQDLSSVRLRAPIRFDYNPDAASATHPASHMTFQSSHARIPVVSPLSPGHFIHFVFKNFYPSMWNAHKYIQEWNHPWLSRTITQDEQRMLHFNSLR